MDPTQMDKQQQKINNIHLASVIISCINGFYVLVTIIWYMIKVRQYPRYFTARSPTLTIVGSICGLVVTTIFLLVYITRGSVSCQSHLWTEFIGFAIWQAMLVRRAMKLSWTIRHHQKMTFASSWYQHTQLQENNRRSILDRGQFNVRRYRRIDRHWHWAAILFLTIVLLSAILIAVLLRDQWMLGDETSKETLDPTTAAYIEWLMLHWATCYGNWEAYAFVALWGILAFIWLLVATYYLRNIYDVQGIRLELLITAFAELLIYLIYIVWTVTGTLGSFFWLWVLFFISHSVSVCGPILGLYWRQRLLKRVSRAHWEQVIHNERLWQELCQFASRDFCSESTRFIEDYRNLLKLTIQTLGISDTNADIASSTLWPLSESTSPKPSTQDETRRSTTRKSRLSDSLHSILTPPSPGATSLTFALQLQPTREEEETAICIGSPQSETYLLANLSNHHLSVPNTTSTRFAQPQLTRSSMTMDSTITHQHTRLHPTLSSPSERPGPAVPESLIVDYRRLYETYIRDQAPLQVNISDKVRRLATERVKAYRYTVNMFYEVYLEVEWSIYSETFPKFVEAFREELAELHVT
jgi:hypothetical protein